MRLGFGFVFEADCPAVTAAAEAGLGIGPPDPSVPLTPDAWMARFAGALLDGGNGVASAASVAAMTTDRLTLEQRRGSSAQTFLDGFGWG